MSKPTYPPVAEQNSRWKYRLTEDWSIKLKSLEKAMRGKPPYQFSTHDKDNQCVMRLEADGGVLTIKFEYAFDGCSGTPNKIGNHSLPGCLVHDAVRQANRVDKDCPWSRWQTELMFKETMALFRFHFLGRWTYFLTVAGPIGWAYHLLSKWRGDHTEQLCRLPE